MRLWNRLRAFLSPRPRPLTALVPYPLGSGTWLAGVAVVLALFDVVYLEDHTATRLPAALMVLLAGTALLVWGELRAGALWRLALQEEASRLARWQSRLAWQGAQPEVFGSVLAQLLEAEGYRFLAGPDGLRHPPVGFHWSGYGPDEARVGVAIIAQGPKPVTEAQLASPIGLGLAAKLDTILVATPSTFTKEAQALADALPDHLLRVELLDAEELARRAASLPFFAALDAELNGFSHGQPESA